MEEFVARENIRRFRNQLLVVEDDAERRLLLQLLSAEEQKLDAIISTRPQEIGVRRLYTDQQNVGQDIGRTNE
jgi:hypothetical protein